MLVLTENGTLEMLTRRIGVVQGLELLGTDAVIVVATPSLERHRKRVRLRVVPYLRDVRARTTRRYHLHARFSRSFLSFARFTSRSILR